MLKYPFYFPHNRKFLSENNLEEKYIFFYSRDYNNVYFCWYVDSVNLFLNCESEFRNIGLQTV